MQVHIFMPYLTAGLVAWNSMDENHAKLVAAFISALVSPVLAVTNTGDAVRRWLYVVLPALQALVIGFDWATEAAIAPLFSGIVAVLGSSLAATNTSTSTGPLDERGGRHRAPDEAGG
jgi:hypothetical protein